MPPLQLSESIDIQFGFGLLTRVQKLLSPRGFFVLEVNNLLFCWLAAQSTSVLVVPPDMTFLFPSTTAGRLCMRKAVGDETLMVSSGLVELFLILGGDGVPCDPAFLFGVHLGETLMTAPMGVTSHQLR